MGISRAQGLICCSKASSVTDFGGKEWWRYPCNGLASIPEGEEILLIILYKYKNCNSFGNMTVWQISDLASVNERLQGEQIFWLALRAALTMMH